MFATLHRLEVKAEKHSTALFWALVLAVVVLAIGLRSVHLTDVPSRSPDERVYTQFAQRIAADGLGAYRPMFERYAADPSQWIYPSPTRLVHVMLFAGVMKVTGSSSAQAGAAVSWALGIASVLLLAAMGRRFWGRGVGVLAAFFLATYVVEIEFARRAWGEATGSFLSLVLMYSTLALHSQPDRWRSRLAFFAAGTLCLLVKETSALTYACCGLWLVASAFVQARGFRYVGLLASGALLSLLVAFGVLVLLSGSVRHVLDGLTHGVGSKDWGARNASGPWYEFGHALWLMAPLTLSLAVVGGLVVVLGRRSGRVFEGLEPGARWAAGLALLLTLGFAGASAFGPNLQYLRIMAPANASYCLLAALGARFILLQSEGWLRGKAYLPALALMPVAIVVASQRDLALYADVVVRSGMQDLAARWIIDGVARRDQPRVEHTQQSLQSAPTATPPASSLLNRSLEHCQNQEFAHCVSAAQAALQRDPNLAEAWNNGAMGYAGLRLWGDAERYLRQALALRPDFQLAINNLAWVTEEKAKVPASLQP
jgi:hypothetical protein